MKKDDNEKNKYIANRKIDPTDIKLPEGYKVEVYKERLTTPINMIFTDDRDMLVGDAGIISGSGKVLKLTNDGFEVIAEGFNPPLTGINYYKGNIYVSHRGYITIVKPDGSKKDILSGLPSFGDHHNNQVIFGPDGKMYFGQGTATNSGVVGNDNYWVKNHPFFHDYPGSNIVLKGYNFRTKNILTEDKDDYVYTGAYCPYGTENYNDQMVKGITRASGSILRANPDGTNLEMVAWGLRNPFRLKFDCFNKLFSTNHGMDVRGSRPIANSPDELYLVSQGAWYGWPDYTGGLPVTMPVFKAEEKSQPKFLLAKHPMEPPEPFTVFEPHSAIMGFDFNYNKKFGVYGDAYIAEFGSEAPETTGGKPLPRVGHRVTRIDMRSGKKYIFAINKSGFAASYNDTGGFERPIDVVFGPDDDMYVVDFGMSIEEEKYIPKTGVIWRITKK